MNMQLYLSISQKVFDSIPHAAPLASLTEGDRGGVNMV